MQIQSFTFLVGRVAILATVSTHPPIHLVLRALFPGVNQLKREGDIHLNLLPRLIMSGATPPLLYMPEWGEEGQVFPLIEQTCNNTSTSIVHINKDGRY
jgi:hypothetical protein